MIMNGADFQKPEDFSVKNTNPLKRTNSMKFFTFSLLLSSSLILGCGIPLVKTSWSKPGAQPGEFERDSEVCDQDPGRAGFGPLAAYDVCMQQKGWFLVEEPAN